MVASPTTSHSGRTKLPGAAAPPNCRQWIADHREGRLSYQTGRGPRSVVVRYAVAANSIMIRLPDYNDIVHYAPGSVVSLHIDGQSKPLSELNEVTVTGRAALVDCADLPADPVTERWPAGVPTSLIVLPMTNLEVSTPERVPPRSSTARQ